MKNSVKNISLLLAVLTLSAYLFGCVNNKITEDDETSKKVTETVSAEVTTSVENEPETSLYGEGVTGYSLPKTDGYEKITDGVYNLAFPKNYEGEIEGIYGKTLLVSEVKGEYIPDDKNSYRLLLLDLSKEGGKDEKVIARTEFDGYFPKIGFLDDGRVYISVEETSTVYLLDKNLRQTSEHFLDGYKICGISGDGESILLQSRETNEYKLRSVVSNTINELTLVKSNKTTAEIFWSDYDGEDFFTLAVDKENCTYTKMITQGDDTVNGVAVLSYNGTLSLTSSLVPTLTEVFSFGTNETHFPVDRIGACFMLASYPSEGGTAITVLDAEKSTSSTFHTDNYIYDGVLSKDGFGVLVLSDFNDGSRQYVLWDYSSSPAEAIIKKQYEAEGISGINAKIVADIKKHSGITVHVGNEGNDYPDNGYLCRSVTDPMAIFSYLTKLQSNIEMIRSETWKEMCGEDGKGIDIYLCGQFYLTEGGTISNPAAITTRGYNKVFMCYDITDDIASFDTNFWHELMHVIEVRIDETAEEYNIDIEGEWLNLSPKNSYFNAYTDSKGNTLSDRKYTVDGEKKASNVYFVDGYSRTYPLEDRARIFEHLVTDNDEAMLTKYGNIGEKAHFLCAMIRFAFPSIREAEVGDLPWERLVGEVHTYDYEIFPFKNPSETTTIATPEPIAN